jgi:dihydrofolate reductase
VIFGGAGMAQTFMQLGLIDEYHLLVHPIVLGRGKLLFKDLHDQLNLKLLKTKVFGSGVVLLDY